MFWNIFKKKEEAAKAVPQLQPQAAGQKQTEKKETVEERIEREIAALPGPMKKQMANPEIKAKFVEIAKRMEKDGVDFKNVRLMKKWIKEHEAELKQEQMNGPKIETVKRTEAEQTGRNEPCPCGSGKKYKKCCGGK